MSERKINLEEILISNFPEEESGYSYKNLNNVTKAYIKKAMKEFGKQLLELSAENAIVRNGENFINGWGEKVSGAPYIVKDSITDTIKQVE